MKNHQEFYSGDLRGFWALIWIWRQFGGGAYREPQVIPVVKTRGQYHPRRLTDSDLRMAAHYERQPAVLKVIQKEMEKRGLEVHPVDPHD